ncbi:hypothetical protein [Streptosporangium sp. NPDC002607]
MIIDGRYELDALPLGQGGMGEVYGAYDQKLDRRVAVKLLRFPYGKPDEKLVKRFLHEARIMAKLEHPGTPPIHDVGVFEDPKVGPRPVHGDAVRRGRHDGPHPGGARGPLHRLGREDRRPGRRHAVRRARMGGLPP